MEIVAQPVDICSLGAVDLGGRRAAGRRRYALISRRFEVLDVCVDVGKSTTVHGSRELRLSATTLSLVMLLFRLVLGYQATQAKLMADFTVVFHDKRTASRLLFTEILVRLVNRLVVVDCVEDIQGVVEMLHVPRLDNNGVVAVITDLDPKVLWCYGEALGHIDDMM